MKIFSYIFILLIVFLGLSFAVLNATPVHLNYYFGSSQISLALLLALTLGAGAVFGLILALPSYLRAKRMYRKLKHALKQAEKEIENLRAIPIRNTH